MVDSYTERNDEKLTTTSTSGNRVTASASDWIDRDQHLLGLPCSTGQGTWTAAQGTVRPTHDAVRETRE